jgi:hypothetical protein
LGDKLDLPWGGPWIVTGHQPELFHPGVWIKSMATVELARAMGGTPIHVLIDNDTLKSSAIRVPAGGPEQFVVGHVPFDQWDREIPFEERRVVDEAIFRDFAERVRVTMSKLPFRPLVSAYWEEVLRASRKTPIVGERLAAGRRAIERAWGWGQTEVPLGRLCDTESFAALWVEIARRAIEFRDIYNDLLARYRRRYKVRSKNHPASDLALEGDRCELPFWVWNSDQPERVPLWVTADTGQLWAGSTPLPRLLPSHSPADAIRTLVPWKIRPRALITTLFLRGLVADWFIHGIGGGKYDEVTDDLLVGFLGWPSPPGMAVLSGTLFLPGPVSVDLPHEIAQTRSRVRDTYWNPERYLGDHLRERDPLAGWIEEKQTLQHSPEAAEKNWSREDWRHFRQLNDRIRPYVEASRQESDRQVAILLEQERSHRALHSRDYAFCLHPEETLLPFLKQVSLGDGLVTPTG